MVVKSLAVNKVENFACNNNKKNVKNRRNNCCPIYREYDEDF